MIWFLFQKVSGIGLLEQIISHFTCKLGHMNNLGDSKVISLELCHAKRGLHIYIERERDNKSTMPINAVQEQHLPV